MGSKQLKTNLKWLVPACILIIVWVWTLFFAQYRYQIFEVGDSIRKLFLITLFLTLVSVAFLINFLTKSYDRKQKYQAILGAIVLGIPIYGAILGFILTVNAVFDWDEKVTYKTKVITSYIENGKNTHYWVVVENTWASKKEGYRIDLSRKEFFKSDFRPGEEVLLIIGKGSLGFPWIQAVLKKEKSDI